MLHLKAIILNQTLLLLSFLFSYCFSFSQTEKLIRGKVLSGELLLKNIDIVNINSKKSVITDSNGDFTILAKVEDELFILSKEYNDLKIKLTQKEFEKDNLVITIEKKPIEIEEVKVQNKIKVRPIITQADLDAIKLSKQASNPKVPNVYTGEIENGMDFIRLGKDIIGLFKNKDKVKPKKSLPLIGFKDYIHATFNEDFFSKKLKLNSDEIGLFLSFCEVDSKARTIVEHQNEFETMDFLISKKEDFKKLNSFNK